MSRPPARASASGTQQAPTDWASGLLVGLGAVAVAFFVWLVVPWGGERVRLWVGDGIFVPFGLASALLAFRVGRHPGLHSRARRGWRRIALAFLAWAFGDAYWFYAEVLRGTAPFPSWADVGYLAFYGLLLWGLLTLSRSPRTRAERTKFALDIATVMLGATMVVWYLVVVPALDEGGGDALSTLLSLAYPVGDLVLVLGVATAFLRTRGHGHGAALRPLLLGAAFLVVADLVHVRLELTGSYSAAGAPDAFWLAAQFLFALAGHTEWRRLAAGRPDGEPRPLVRTSPAPYAAMAAGYGLLLYAGWQAPGPLRGLVLGAAALTAVVALRQIVGLRDNVRLLDDLHRMADETSRIKNDFLANVSHEIRTPMNAVLGMTGLLLDTELTADQRDYASTVRQSGEALLDIVNDILDFSKIEAGRLRLEVIDFDLRTVVEDVADMLAPQAHAKGLELATLTRDIPTGVRGDPGRLRQVLVHLVGNAVKFTDQGEVVVRADLASESDGEVVVRFEVADTGVGITEGAQRHLFESFYQGDSSSTRRHGGTGLGLAVSRRLVELMGGTIGVESTPGLGSTFRFTVVLQRAPGGSVTTTPVEDLAGVSVLVVDDNETNRRILLHQVGTWGMHAVAVDGGAAALDTLRAAAARGAPFDLAILDKNMPGMNGIVLAALVSADPALRTTRLVMLTSAGIRGEAEQARQAGLAGYLTKPIRQSHLHGCLAAVMGRPRGSLAALVTRHSLRDTGARARAHVLVTEDNTVNQKVVVKMLEQLGYRADVAGNGFEALEALRRIPYAAVLMDCQMPEMDGYVATGEIRRLEREEGSGTARHVPVIAITASATRDNVERCRAAGMDDFVAKPVDVDHLADVLARWIPPVAPPEVLPAPAGVLAARGVQPGTPAGPSPGPAAAVVPLDPPLDAGRLEVLRSMPGGAETFAQVVALFLHEMPARIGALTDAVGRGDPQALEFAAHRLKGAGATLGAARLARLCERLETMGRSGSCAEAADELPIVCRELDRVRDALLAEVEARRPASRS